VGKFERFSDAEIEAIQNAFWQERIFRELGEGDVPCPACGADCRVLLAKTMGFPRHLMATCHACSKHSQFRSIEQQGPDLDETTTREIVKRHQSHLETICAHCHTPIDVRETHALGGTLIYHVFCRRCGSSGELRWR